MVENFVHIPASYADRIILFTYLFHKFLSEVSSVLMPVILSFITELSHSSHSAVTEVLIFASTKCNVMCCMCF